MWFLQVSKNSGAWVAFRAAAWCGSVQRSAWRCWCPICAWCSVPHARSKTPRRRIPQTNQSPHTNRTICIDEGARTRLPWRPRLGARSGPPPQRDGARGWAAVAAGSRDWPARDLRSPCCRGMRGPSSDRRGTRSTCRAGCPPCEEECAMHLSW